MVELGTKPSAPLGVPQLSHSPRWYYLPRAVASCLQRQTIRGLWGSNGHYLSSPGLKCWYFAQQFPYLPGNNKTGSSHWKKQEAAVCTLGQHKSQTTYNSSTLNLSCSWSLGIKSDFLFDQFPCAWSISNTVAFLRKGVRQICWNIIWHFKHHQGRKNTWQRLLPVSCVGLL